MVCLNSHFTKKCLKFLFFEFILVTAFKCYTCDSKDGDGCNDATQLKDSQITDCKESLSTKLMEMGCGKIVIRKNDVVTTKKGCFTRKSTISLG